ncbi:MAG: Gfo/Idh/MocA family oxidoreductase, partial [Phycisphaerales bacterium]
LLVHKATHHFDLVNWWLATVPETVYANGKRVFYNTAQAKRYGLENHGQRCLECPVSNRCNFYLDIKRVGELKQLYLDNETYDGYFRDCCVFEDGDSDIEDVANVIVEYKNGALLSYSLNAFMPWEGYRVEFNGTKGRLEHCCQEASYISGDGSIQGALKPEQTAIRIYPHFQTPYSVEVRQSQGDHGGGDIAMVDDLFGPLRPDPLRRAADYKQGAWSILTGIAANKSITTGKVIRIEKLVTGLPADVFSQTIDENEKIPYVPCAKRLADI